MATIDLQLTRGIKAALPIAIIPFADENTLVPDQQITPIIKNDLQNSGYFRVASHIKNMPHPTSSESVQYRYWRKKGFDNILIGKVQAKGNQYQVSFQLLDTLAKKHVLLAKTFQVPKKVLRRFGHHISDLVYQELLGVRGVFATKIAYVLVKRDAHKPTEYRLEVADMDGHNPHALFISPEPLMSPTWSPDAKKIAFVSFEHKKAEIFVVDVITGKRDLITGFPGINGAPAWSPDGKRLALVLSKTGYPQIYVLDMRQGRLKQKTHGNSIDTEPSWSPDGQSLLFTSDRGGSPQIYRLSLRDNQIERVSFQGNYNARASYAMNGNKIIMLHREGGAFNIAVYDLVLKQLLNLTRSGRDESPTLAPNAKMILYATQYGNKGVLSIVSLDGRVQLRLPSRDGDVQEPTWSPFVG